MLKRKMFYLSALVAVSSFSFATQPAFSQLAESDEPSDMEIEISLNAPEDGVPGFEGPGDEEMSIALNVPAPGGIAAMRGHGGPGGPPGRHHGGGDCPLMMLTGDNAVTDDQFEKLYDLKNRTLDQIGPKMLDMHSAQRHLRDALTQENIDEKAAKKLQSQITGLKADLEGIKLDAKMSMMQILTGAQRKELRLAMMKGGMRGRCGPGGPGGHHMMMKKYMEKKQEH